MKTQDEIMNEMLDYFEEHDDEFVSVIEELDDVTDFLRGERRRDMDDLESELDMGLLMDIYNGCDADGDSQFSPYRAYFYRDAFGVLYSTDKKDYTGWLIPLFIEKLIRLREKVDYILPDEISSLITKYVELGEN